ncbi:MAG: acyl-CoA dehydratase activase [Deltaproteobacteria bacterium]|nr:acyl-CoA dehydratase activase [Deltaproteobacteria bacterium]
MSEHLHILGIDIGSVAIAVAAVTPLKRIERTAYGFHHGNIRETLASLLADFDLSLVRWVAATTSSPSSLKTTCRYDNRIATITAAQALHKKVGSILIVGGEKFGLIRFDENGHYTGYKANTSCAAGTGSFLDQQAERLGLEDVGELGALAFANTGSVPKIASRCAVFAKTDLVHAQQEGYGLSEICDGLCFGLARNIVDTLFVGQEPIGPVIFSGGVSRNRAVVRHVRHLVQMEVIPEVTYLGAVGAAFSLAVDGCRFTKIELNSAMDLVAEGGQSKKYYFDPLELKLSDYPDFDSLERYDYHPSGSSFAQDVEVDVYRDFLPFADQGDRCKAYLGIDIGSTSTKAVILSPSKSVLAGFYTRTGGRPVVAVQNLLAAIEEVVIGKGVDLHISGAGTTGSGRKFVGGIVGADLIVDEITAHARAAVEINPEVDTILEIGGQDSKFTTLKDGSVTFSIMNRVCAAGTGSFIEEQAQKLDCPLTSYAERTEGQRSPITSDRCTVFMERDVNYYLSEGYTKNEMLASVLHAIRENYLTKVAVESSIGQTILFQGATAKNRALVAAFEQRLEKPIHVSRYCHLAGAMGVALKLADRSYEGSEFKGLDLHRKTIPIRSEVCELCTNHCKITAAHIDGRTAAYGFLCGRDYDTRKFVDNNTSGFDLLTARKKVLRLPEQAKPDPGLKRETVTVGLPAVLHMADDMAFWKYFFGRLGIDTITSETYAHGVKEGKHIAGAEFCAPMAAMHGHVSYLRERADRVFLPFYLDHHPPRDGNRRQYCYYTQFAPSLASFAKGSVADRTDQWLLTPLIRYLYNRFHARVQLYRMLKSFARERIGFARVSAAYEEALQFKKQAQEALRRLYRDETREKGRLHVVLLGRPYTVLQKCMNKGIPNILASMGIKTFYQDMLTVTEETKTLIAPLLKELHWHYAVEVVKAAACVAASPDAYPVLVTSFKCTPDAFVVEYFKQIMERAEKPYLVLQLDEHDSNVGYETRIEAAIRSFRNHHAGGRKTPGAAVFNARVRTKRSLDGKTLIMPNWGDISQRLVVANLRREGIDARLLEEHQTSIQRSLRYNTGQCIPLNIIGQEFIDYVERHDLDPSRCALWMIRSAIPCNLKLFPFHIEYLFKTYGGGFEQAEVYPGTMSFADISKGLPIATYFAYMFGGMVKKLGCAVRPYELNPGETDAVIEESLCILEDAFLGNRRKESAVIQVVDMFRSIARGDRAAVDCTRPKVAIFGDLYARDNELFNQGLVHQIEGLGGEVVTTPYSSLVKMIAKPYLRKWFVEGNYLEVLSSKAVITAATHMEKKYYKHFQKVLQETEPAYDDDPARILAQYNIRIENTGESMENILKIHYVLKQHPDVALFVQASPAFCCPSLVTEAMAKDIERQTGVPVVSITYDGTGGEKNEPIIPYLNYLKKAAASAEKMKTCRRAEEKNSLSAGAAVDFAEG